MQPAPRDTPSPFTASVDGDRIRLPRGSGAVSMPIVPLPDRLIEWFDEGRRAMYRQLAEEREAVGFFSHHLPVVVTRSGEGIFPFSCGNKGVGFLPRAEHLAEFVDLYRHTIERTRGLPWRDSLAERLEAVTRFQLDHAAVDHRCLGTLEIFEKATFRNLQRDPVASLLFTGSCPSYTSFQLNCGVEILGEGDARLEFLRLSRALFEYDGFHIAQPRFRHAYLFWIVEIVDKTPYRVEVPMASGEDDGFAWDGDAEEALGGIPGLVRRHVREQIEAHARSRGLDRVTGAFVAEIRHAMRLAR